MTYAYDNQLYITCDGAQVPNDTIEEYVGEIRNGMRTNMLALDERKTEVLHFSSKFYGQGAVAQCDIRVGDVSMSPSNAMCDRGVMTDSAGTTSSNFSRLCKSASFA